MQKLCFQKAEYYSTETSDKNFAFMVELNEIENGEYIPILPSVSKFKRLKHHEKGEGKKTRK